MVLPGITESSKDSLVDDPFQTDNDPYDSDGRSAASLDFKSLPRPIPILGPLIGFGKGATEATIKDALKQAEQIMGRSMTYDEALALSTIWAKKTSIASYFTAVGVGSAGLQAYRTRDIFRYPFWTPNPEKFNPNQFFMITGPRARALFHVTRVIPYLVLGQVVGSLIGNSWGTTYAIQQTRSNEKLKDFKDAMIRRAQEMRSARPNQPAPTEVQRPTPGGRARASDENDDMSPTSGADTWSDSSSSPTDFPASEGVYEKLPSARPAGTSPSNAPQGEQSMASAAFPGEVEEKQSRPISSWERIRRTSAGQASTPPQSSVSSQSDQRGSSTPEDTFAFSRSDGERELAKLEAQQEFDARVERERRGQHFEDRGKKW